MELNIGMFFGHHSIPIRNVFHLDLFKTEPVFFAWKMVRMTFIMWGKKMVLSSFWGPENLSISTVFQDLTPSPFLPPPANLVMISNPFLFGDDWSWLW